jgi:hypothetical protein
MTFRGILSGIYGDGFHVCNDPSLASVEARLKKHRCVEFHVMPGQDDWVNLHAEIARQDRWDLLDGMDCFTMVREPVEQILSLYYFMVKIRAEIEPVMRARGVAFPETIWEFLDYREHYNNQTAFLVGKSQHGGRFIGGADLAEAQRIMARLNMHVGLTERFTDSLAIFQAVTGRQLPRTGIVVENRNAERPPLQAIPARVRERIREESALDLELYDFARERFAADSARCSQPARRFFLPLPAAAGWRTNL